MRDLCGSRLLSFSEWSQRNDFGIVGSATRSTALSLKELPGIGWLLRSIMDESLVLVLLNEQDY